MRGKGASALQSRLDDRAPSAGLGLGYAHALSGLEASRGPAWQLTCCRSERWRVSTLTVQALLSVTAYAEDVQRAHEELDSARGAMDRAEAAEAAAREGAGAVLPAANASLPTGGYTRVGEEELRLLEQQLQAAQQQLQAAQQGLRTLELAQHTLQAAWPALTFFGWTQLAVFVLAAAYNA